MPNTAVRRTRPSLQKGQAIVLIALLILVLFGMLGLAIDSGRAYVDRRDQQAAVDAAALSAGDWYENFNDLSHALNGVQVYANDLRLYGGLPTPGGPVTTYVGPFAEEQDQYTYNWPQGYKLVVTATNTTVNGYEFEFDTTHQLPLAFMQIFGGAGSITITATATAIVNNQRQTPALLTLSTGNCATKLTGSAQLTVLGDVYTNGTACLDSSLHEAGNCYGGAGSNCSVATYYCYNGSAGFIPYAPDPTCNSGDTLGTAIVPAPTLPDPGYLAGAATTDCGGGSCYALAEGYSQWNRGTWTEMYPGVYGAFHLSGGSASCAFLDPGVYTWSAGYTSDATRSLLSNELKPPDEGVYNNMNALASPQFWNQNGTSCAGHFTLANSSPAQNILMLPTCTDLSPVTPSPCHSGVTDTLSRNNRWGVELTSVRFDRYADSSTSSTCTTGQGCRRESAPSMCQLTPNAVVGGLHSPSNIGISINITQNAPGAQYYNVYLDPSGCETPTSTCNLLCIQSHFGWVARFDAPGFSGGTPIGPYPSSATPWTLGATAPGLPPAAGASLYDLNDQQVAHPATLCYSQTRTFNCNPPVPEIAPQCFSSCPPPANLLAQENALMDLEYPPYLGGDVANENYCQVPPNPGDINSPCQGSTVTPGGVQFYFPNGSCFSQNAQGATFVYAGEQFNWIVIYAPASNTCSESLNGGAATQYIGTIYTPGANWSINGGDRSPLAGQVICYTAVVSGGGQAGIDFNPNYSPAPPAARLIN